MSYRPLSPRRGRRRVCGSAADPRSPHRRPVRCPRLVHLQPWLRRPATLHPPPQGQPRGARRGAGGDLPLGVSWRAKYQQSLIGTHCDGLARFPARSALRRDAGASQAAHDAARKPRQAARRVVFRASSGRRNRLTMRQHRRRGPSCRGCVKHDHNESLSMIVGISSRAWRDGGRWRRRSMQEVTDPHHRARLRSACSDTTPCATFLLACRSGLVVQAGDRR